MMSLEDQILNKEFRNAYQDKKAPEDLKKDTLNRMLAEDARSRQENSKAHKRKNSFWLYGTAAAVLCAAVLTFMVLRPGGISYITPMEEGVFYDEVELEDGTIRFLPGRVFISISPNAGQAVVGQEEDAGSLSYGKEAEVIEQTESESGGELKYIKQSIVSMPGVGEDDWSYIGEQKIYVSVLRTDGMRCQAIYEKEDEVYEVIGTNVTQKEFIDYLYQKIND